MSQQVNYQEKLAELKSNLQLIGTDRNFSLLSSYWVKVGLPNENLLKYIEACDLIGYNDQDKKDDSLYQLATEVTLVTEEEKEVFSNLHNTLREIIETIEILKKENGQTEDQ